MRFKKIVKLFESDSVCVTGMKGSGKDLLTSNVIARRKQEYVSNFDYACTARYTPLDFNKLDMSKNTYKDLINGNVRRYIYPYNPNADIYISDIGVYFPSQYCNELNKAYPYIPLFLALSRHFGNKGGVRVHLNVQNLNRAWDKFREHSDTYITTNKCKVIFGWVIQQITIYEKASSCQERIRPCRVKVPLIGDKQNVKIYLDQYDNTYGKVRQRWLFYKHKSNYNSQYFKEVFENGKV